MNVFEDLVVELKEENLLEETFIDFTLANGNGHLSIPDAADGASSQPSANGHAFSDAAATSSDSANARTRLAKQIASMELVELVLSAIANANGRQSLPYDVLSVKKSFHRYSQATADQGDEDRSDVEIEVLSSVEEWQHDLELRDKNISTAAFRKYVESANPPLGPQALFALVRFYRSIPDSRETIAKFDFVVTRLFSKFVDGERREILCPRTEIVKYLTQRYTEWSLDNFRSVPGDDPQITVPSSSFDALAAEAESTLNFGDMIKSGLFGRVAELKESNGRAMFVPRIMAAAVEANLRISSHVLNLLELERERHGSAMSSKFSDVDFSLVSDAVARTFDSIGAPPADETFEDEHQSRTAAEVERIKPDRPVRKLRSHSISRGDGRRSSIFGVNRWLLLATIVIVTVSIGIYIWADRVEDTPVRNDGVKVVDLEKPELKRFLKTSKISGTMLYAVITPAFEEMSVDVQREYLKSLYQFGPQKGYDRVTLINERGRNIAFADSGRLELTAR
jgi:hypothetical protein